MATRAGRVIEGTSTYSRSFSWKLVPSHHSPAPLFLLLHGFRQNKEESLRYWSQLEGRVHLLAPDGPLIHEFARPRKLGFAWYVYDGNRDKFREEMDQTSLALNDLIQEASSQVEIDDIWVGGFSQGAYLALYYGLCVNPKVSHVHAVAGNFNVNFVKETLQGKKIWLHHTDNDPSCPPERIETLEKLLVSKKCTVERRCFSGSHEFLPEMLAPLLEYFQN